MFSSSSLVSILIKGSNRNLFDDVFPTLFATRGRLRAERGILETGSVCMSEISILLSIDELGAALIIVCAKLSSKGVFFCWAFLYGYGASALNCKLFSLAIFNATLQRLYDSKFPKPHIDKTLLGTLLRHIGLHESPQQQNSWQTFGDELCCPVSPKKPETSVFGLVDFWSFSSVVSKSAFPSQDFIFEEALQIVNGK